LFVASLEEPINATTSAAYLADLGPKQSSDSRFVTLIHRDIHTPPTSWVVGSRRTQDVCPPDPCGDSSGDLLLGILLARDGTARPFGGEMQTTWKYEDALYVEELP
jgi:hypothetical protein